MPVSGAGEEPFFPAWKMVFREKPWTHSAGAPVAATVSHEAVWAGVALPRGASSPTRRPLHTNTAAASKKLASRINVSRSIQPIVPVEVTISNRTATLRGVVATANGRDLAVRLVLLEPGISRVKNELTVASSDEQPDSTSRP